MEKNWATHKCKEIKNNQNFPQIDRDKCIGATALKR